MDCPHTLAATCWLCADDRDWWREARIKAGLGEEPPNAGQRKRDLIDAEIESVAEKAWYPRRPGPDRFETDAARRIRLAVNVEETEWEEWLRS